jgi:Integrase core domain
VNYVVLPLRVLPAVLAQVLGQLGIQGSLDLIHRQIYSTRQDARANVFNYIEMFYNAKRRHNTSGCVSPVEFENANPNGSEVSSRSGSIHSEIIKVARACCNFNQPYYAQPDQ